MFGPACNKDRPNKKTKKTTTRTTTTTTTTTTVATVTTVFLTIGRWASQAASNRPSVAAFHWGHHSNLDLQASLACNLIDRPVGFPGGFQQT